MTDQTIKIAEIEINLDTNTLAAFRVVVEDFSIAIRNLLPPLLELLVQARRGLFLDLEELEFLAAGVQIYNRQAADTTYGTDSHLLAIIDCLDWTQWNLTHGHRLHGKMTSTLSAVWGALPISSRTARLNILALVDGLNQAIRMTDVELDEHPYYLTIDQALTEVFELDAD